MNANIFVKSSYFIQRFIKQIKNSISHFFHNVISKLITFFCFKKNNIFVLLFVLAIFFLIQAVRNSRPQAIGFKLHMEQLRSTGLRSMSTSDAQPTGQSYFHKNTVYFKIFRCHWEFSSTVPRVEVHISLIN